MSYQIYDLLPLAARPAEFSLYVGYEVLPAAPGGFSASVAVDGVGIFHVSRLEGESAWTVDGKSLENGLPIFYNGRGARYLKTRALVDAEIVAALDAVAEGGR